MKQESIVFIVKQESMQIIVTFRRVNFFVRISVKKLRCNLSMLITCYIFYPPPPKKVTS